MARQIHSAQIETRALSANGMTFHCRVCGLENQGDPVILLHGFPETSKMWEGMLRSLAAQGYRCLAPDQRGYSPGARPTSVESYRIDTIASDVIALADAVGFSSFHLIGHDWGAGCGWTVVELYPERVQSWSALSIPHMAAFETARKTDFEQKLRSWYIDSFQAAVTPELALGAVINLPWLLWPHVSDAEVADYLRVFKEFESRRAAINWYRANQPLPVQYKDVYLPTLLIWGNQDPAVGRAGIRLTQPYMKGEYLLLELSAGHMLIHEKFERINYELLSHIQRHSS